MANNMLIPTSDLIADYQAGRVIGAWLARPAADNLPTYVKRYAQYRHDEFKAESGSNYLFASSPKSQWHAGEGKGKRALLWKSWLTLDSEKALFGAQLTGDCVSWGERCKQEVRRCVEILNKGEREIYKARQATCLLYSGRGHTGQGASPIGIANWATKCGILLEEMFTDSAGKQWDCREYANYVKFGINYGASGMPRAVIDVTSKNRVVGQAKVSNTAEAMDLLYNGYAISLGFSLDTAPVGNPVSRLQGSTAHETCIVGYDDTEVGRAMCKKSLGYEDAVFMYDQSWGNWNKVTDLPQDWLPWGQGMYAHSARDVQRHLNEGEATACTGSIQGFVGTKLNNLLI